MESIDHHAKPTVHLWLRRLLLAGVAMVIVTFAASLIRYPDMLSMYPRQAPLFLSLLGILMALYTLVAVGRTRTRSRAEVIALNHGAFWGGIVGLLWTVEIWAGNIAQPSAGWQDLLVHGLIYRGAILAVPVVTVVGAGIAAARARSWPAGMWVGIISGVLSGLMVFGCFLVFGLVLPSGRPDPQTLAQFGRTGLTDFAAYSAAENLAAMINHLWIGPGLGVLCGLFGGAIGGGLAPRAGSAAAPDDASQAPDDRRVESRLAA